MDQDDGEIVERVLAGDRDAFAILIDRHHEGATRFALRILRGRGDAEDVVVLPKNSSAANVCQFAD